MFSRRSRVALLAECALYHRCHTQDYENACIITSREINNYASEQASADTSFKGASRSYTAADPTAGLSLY